MADVPYPYFGTPQDTQNWLDVQRKQQIAQMLMGSLQQANQTPANWDSMRVVPKRGAIQNLSVLADALMARKGLDAANQSIANYMNPPQPAQAQPYDAAAASQAPEGIAAPPPGPGSPTNTPTAPGLLPQQDTVMGIPRPVAAQLARLPGGLDAIAKQGAANYAPLETDRKLRSAGIDPNSPEGIAFKQQLMTKEATIAPTLVRPNETALDTVTRNPFFTGPDNGVQTTWGPNGPTQSPMPGALQTAKDVAAAKTAGTQGQIPVEYGTSPEGEKLYRFVTPPAAGGSASAPLTAPKTASPAEVSSQQAGAKAGQDYATELRKNSEGAVEIRRSVSELRNLATQATPSAFNNGKLAVGSWMVAAGADPKWVSQRLGVDVAALQAAEHNQGGLAVGAIHGMTSRGTNFDLETFMRQNPNLDMNSPEAFNRVADYMDSKAQQTIERQKDFATGLKTKAWGSPDQWETNHTAHWNDLQNQAITAGKFNTPNPNGKSFATEADAQAAAVAGLIKPGDRIKVGNQTGTWH